MAVDCIRSFALFVCFLCKRPDKPSSGKSVMIVLEKTTQPPAVASEGAETLGGLFFIDDLVCIAYVTLALFNF